ncbi:Fanconi anemia group J [Araneus ventricosus]|uniref:DNA 5'-3' helicase n=1 Tax=Araneus ventricosus TaxID=182803 RepID=A0A4Y2TEU2_ARAVE|nr:Fanconi anemia group J [Araneus ventricosus]
MEFMGTNSPDTQNNELVSSKAYTIGGVPIIFPYKAYPSQITMMDKIIKCLNKKQNCLLESPTGSGKSLALLCACLAWQKKTRREIEMQEWELENELNAHGMAVPDEFEINARYQSESAAFDNESKLDRTNCSDDNYLNKVVERIKIRELKKSNKGIVFIDDPSLDCKPTIQSYSKYFCGATNDDNINCSESSSLNKVPSESKIPEDQNSKRENLLFDDDDFDDFQPNKKYRTSSCSSDMNFQNKVSGSPCQSKHTSNIDSPNQEKVNYPSGCNSSNSCNSPCSKEKKLKEPGKESSTPNKLPIIYFGTRTHKQIEQIIRELKKTPYKNSKMVILSSRERTCIHPEASRADNKNDACDELVKADGGPACKFYRNAKSVSHYHPARLSSAFDLEDFVGTCKKIRACPYYGSRELLSAADIVFCPYNYLTDPLIRSAMTINLKGNIVVTDEAHNIEDSARDAASATISVSHIEEAVLDIEKVGRHSKTIPDCYQHVGKTLSNLVRWLKSNVDNLTDYTSFDSSAKVWAGDTMLALLNYVELGPEHFPIFKKKFEKICAEESDSEKEAIVDMDKPKLLGSTLKCVETLNVVLQYMYMEDMTFVPDYRCVVMKSKVSPPPQSKKKYLTANPFQITINFWCLNPAVAFSDFKGDKGTHSVIVASGTLSPLTSFQSELSMPFPITLEANHVISKSQVWVGTVGKGPKNNILSATYHNAATFAFQDDVGELIYQVCCVIPYGILCFLPSYSMLDKLVNRWQQTRLWNKLESKKIVLCEPRKQSSFAEVIKEFYDAVKQDNFPTSSINGALFLAICRGKVSEGLDFADNNARAVITVGIPFPNIKDTQVDLKRKYNDMYSSKKQIMTGSEWYETQAFRALNQALGRCIRHRNDFGALLIVDERFQKNPRYPEALSKWIRREIINYPSFPAALDSLNSFAEQTGMKTVV